jgi:hypothetical protein
MSGELDLSKARQQEYYVTRDWSAFSEKDLVREFQLSMPPGFA